LKEKAKRGSNEGFFGKLKKIFKNEKKSGISNLVYRISSNDEHTQRPERF
jgi:hypothetical protein